MLFHQIYFMNHSDKHHSKIRSSDNIKLIAMVQPFGVLQKGFSTYTCSCKSVYSHVLYHKNIYFGYIPYRNKCDFQLVEKAFYPLINYHNPLSQNQLTIEVKVTKRLSRFEAKLSGTAA